MKKVSIVLNITILSILFVVVAFVVVTYSSGYIINLKQKSISPTSILEIKADPSDSEIYLENDKVGIGSAVLKNLEPKVYRFKVKKEGYNTFEKYISLEPSRVASFQDITLFMTKPDSAVVNKVVGPEALGQISDSTNIVSANDEIYVDGNFITRLSEPISGACWYPGKNYIAFTSAGKLKIMYKDGSNLIDLLDKTSGSPVIFINSGKSVLYDVSGAVYSSKIR
jgi:hypothetical protein